MRRLGVTTIVMVTLIIFGNLALQSNKKLMVKNEMGASVSNKYGVGFQKYNHCDEAHENFRQALDQFEELLRDQPEAPSFLIKEAEELRNIATNQLSCNKQIAKGEEMYQQSLMKFEMLAEHYPEIPKFKEDLADSYEFLGNLQLKRGEIPTALSSYQKARLSREELIAKYPGNGFYKKQLAKILGSLSWGLLLSGQNQEALELACHSQQLDFGQTWVKPNIAHALLLLGRYKEAEILYLDNPGQILDNKRSFRETVVDDFKVFRQYGLRPVGIEKIEALLGKQPSHS